jgi:hypothetical protein
MKYFCPERSLPLSLLLGIRGKASFSLHQVGNLAVIDSGHERTRLANLSRVDFDPIILVS